MTQRGLLGARVSLATAIAGVVLGLGGDAIAQKTTARLWNEELLHAISLDTARPTVHARNLFSLSTAMYDAWAAYDPIAAQQTHREKASFIGDASAAQNEAISYAAYNLIRSRFVSGPAGPGPGATQTMADLNARMAALGYDPAFAATTGDSPAALGNRVAQTVIAQSLLDGSNEQNRYASPRGFDPVNPRLTFDLPGTTMNDPNRWQPLHFLGNRIDQFGRPINEATQRNLTPFWGQVQPFALKPTDRSANGVYLDQGTPPGLNRGPSEAQFKSDALAVIRLSSQLDPNDGVMIDISPASRGNTPNAPFTNSYDQVGYSVNPITGQPYTPELVKQGDFARVVAEFWADGPRSTAPPGHWNEIRNEVTDKMEALGIAKRIGGVGPVVSDLEWDVKSMFALNGGLHDAAIAAWNHKGVYDSSRPISFIRYMGQLGQSSDPSGPSYHEDGLPLEAGLVEVITTSTTVPGGRHENLAGYEGKIAIRSWKGAIEGVQPFTDPSQLSGVGWVLAETWMPYQLSSFVTPPFAGYVSGHSTYSRTGAEVLTLLTGSEFFPGGIFEYEIPQGSGLDFEYGPMSPMTLQFATYFDASDQASISRVYGGIHPPADDFAGRRIGSLIGPAAWNQSVLLFSGVPEPSGMVLVTSVGLFIGAGRRTRPSHPRGSRHSASRSAA
jgi:hypothetical protein